MVGRKSQLAAVPEVAPKAVAYIRVSKERDEMISPELQLTAIADHCARMGYQLVETLTDLDRTGRFWKRRQVEQAVAMIEQGRAEVLVVWKGSRVARNRLDWAVAVDRVESAGGRLESATEPVDTKTSTGRLARGMLAEFAAFESERSGEVWRETHNRRTRNGLPATGKPRWGYVYADGRFSPDPVTGPVLASLYRRYIAGESIYSLVRWLKDEGHQTIHGYRSSGPGPWTDRSLRRVLDSGFGAGFITVHEELHPGAHEAVITTGEWAAYRAARAARRVFRSSERSQYLLSGLMRCVCGSTMNGGQFGHARVPKYRCKAGHEERRHAGGYVSTSVVEAVLMNWLREHADDIQATADMALASKARAQRRRTDAKALAREITALDAQLTRLTVQLAAEVIPERAYVAARDELTLSRNSLSAKLAQAEADATRVVRTEGIRQLLDDWDVLSVELRRAELKQWIDHIEVDTTTRPRSTVRIVPMWAGD